MFDLIDNNLSFSFLSFVNISSFVSADELPGARGGNFTFLLISAACSTQKYLLQKKKTTQDLVSVTQS